MYLGEFYTRYLSLVIYGGKCYLAIK